MTAIALNEGNNYVAAISLSSDVLVQCHNSIINIIRFVYV